MHGDGGYIVVAPSLHASGKSYRWKDDVPGTTSKVAPLPGWLHQLLVAPKVSAAERVSADGTVPEGECNQTLFSLACGMRRGGLSAEAIVAALVAENQARCSPPLAKDEIERIVESAGKYPAGLSSGGGGTFRDGPNGVEAMVGTGKNQRWLRICGPLKITSDLRDFDSESWAYELNFTDKDGKAKTYQCPQDCSPAATKFGSERAMPRVAVEI